MNMAAKRKLLLFIALATVVSIVVQNLIWGVCFELIGESIFADYFNVYLKAGGDPDSFVINWPWYYILINSLFYSIFWFFLGRVAYKIFAIPYWRYSLLVPVLYFLLSYDLTFVIYLLITLVGGVSAYSRPTPLVQVK